MYRKILTFGMLTLLGACASTPPANSPAKYGNSGGWFSGNTAPPPPSNVKNACSIFGEKQEWLPSSRMAYQRWGVPVHVQLAIIRQESTFRADARPRDPSTGELMSSAFGYGQALNGTWDVYLRSTGKGNANRDSFSDATDFIGWYAHQTEKKTGVPKWDAYNQYLAYHEGQMGFLNRTYETKPWLKKVAEKVAHNAEQYRQQILSCMSYLQSIDKIAAQ